MLQNLRKQSLRDFLSLRHPTISYLRAQTIETSSLHTNSSRPLFKQIEISSGILSVYFNCKYFPQYTRQLLECLLVASPRIPFLGLSFSSETKRKRLIRRLASSGFRLLGEIPAGAMTTSSSRQGDERGKTSAVRRLVKLTIQALVGLDNFFGPSS